MSGICGVFPRSLARLLPFSSKEIANGDGTKRRWRGQEREGEQKQKVLVPGCWLPPPACRFPFLFSQRRSNKKLLKRWWISGGVREGVKTGRWRISDRSCDVELRGRWEGPTGQRNT